jgi:peptide/nickel transport system substrate-binding protein
MEKLNKWSRVAVCMICVCIMLFAFSSNSFAKKSRLSVGFTAEEALENLQTGEAWQYTEMGAVFWPLVYDQFWILGPAPDYDPLPMIVERWETDDYQTWRFYLVKNAKFHDGKPVTAEDVAFTLWYLPKSSPAWDFPDNDIEEKKSIKIIDDYTVEFTLVAKWPGKYPPASWMPVLPKHIWMPHKRKLVNFENKKCIGSGPFKLKKFKGGEYIWMVKNKNYWGEKPSVDEVVFKSYGSQDAINMALKKGQIEFIGYNGSSPLSVEDFKKTENVDVAISPGIALVWLSFNLHKENAIQDKLVRQAIMHGIDRERLIQMVYLGYAKPADSFIYPEMATYNPNLPKYAYSPEKARQMLEKAGYMDKDGDGIRNDQKNGQNMSFEFLVPSAWPDEVKLVKVIKEQLKDIGIQIKMKVVDLDTYYEFIYTPKEDKFDISISSEEPGPNGSWIWEFARGYHHGGAGWNQAYYDNPEFDKVLDAMNAETDLQKQKDLTFKLQEIIAEDLPYALLVRPDLIGPYRTDKYEGHVETMGGLSTWINTWTYFKIRPKK